MSDDPYSLELRGQQQPPTAYNYPSNTNFGEYQKVGEDQPRRCNDGAFAILFIVHLAVMVGVAATYAPQMIADVASSASSSNSGTRHLFSLIANVDNDISNTITNQHRSLEEGYSDESSNGDSGTNDIQDMLTLLGISGIIALLLSSGVLGVMIRHAELLIKVALLFNIICTGIFAIGSFFISPFSAIIGLLLFIFTAYYAYIVWGRIPFAAANLVCATTAVKSNMGLSFLAYSSLPIMLGWSCWWLVSFVSTIYVTSGCDGQGNCSSPPGILVFALLLSYHWTFQVIKNVIHVTVAGTVGTWWFVPSEGTSFCSHGVRDSLVRSLTTSFGSICLGSLLVAIIEALKSMVRNLRESENGGGILLCLAECLLACLADVMEVSEMRMSLLLFHIYSLTLDSIILVFSILICGPLSLLDYTATRLLMLARTCLHCSNLVDGQL